MPTRPSYLESYGNIIPEEQRKKLIEIIKSRYDFIEEEISGEALEQELRSIIAALEQPMGDPLTQYREAERYSRISSSDYNKTMEEVFVDLGALYEQDNLIESSIVRHAEVEKASLRDIRSAMERVENDVRVNTIIKENKTGITDVKYNNFYKNDNHSDDPVFSAWVDVDTHSCKLPRGSDIFVMSYGDMAAAEINLKHYGGGIRGTISREDFRKEKAIDGRKDTFWGEVFLTDEPVVQIYDGEEYYGIICEVEIKFFRRELINYIKFDPFTNYPLSIIKIKYRRSEGEDWSELEIEPEESVQVTEFSFPAVEAKYIMLVLNQSNPSINTYNIPRTVINNAEMWEQIADRELSVSMETAEPVQATQDMIDYITGWRALNDASQRYKKEMIDSRVTEGKDTLGEDIFDVATGEMMRTTELTPDALRASLYGKREPEERDLVEARKYEYLYGAYEIEARRVWYMDKGLYISPRYISNGSILQAEVSVEDVWPSGTNIEYSVTTDGHNWKNIFSEGDYIYRERIDIDPYTRRGVLRFPTTDVLLDTIYKNNLPIPESEGYFFYEENNMVEIIPGWYTGRASYTASYTPAGVGDVSPSGKVVDFSEDPVRETQDVFREGASRNHKVELRFFPFINYNIINNTREGGMDPAESLFVYIGGRWYNGSGDVAFDIEPGEYYDPIIATVDGYPAENRTDYYKGIRPALTEYNPVQYPNYEYFQVGKNLYFNTKIEDKEISARYQYLNNFIQFRALLRNNNVSTVDVTPILKNYTLKLRTA